MRLPSIVHVHQVRIPYGARLRAVVQAVAVSIALPLAGCGGSPSQPTPTPQPPTLTCPADVAALSHDGAPVGVDYVVPSAANGAAPVTVACVPGPGSSFGVGTNTVTCTATDALARTATCNFAVSVSVVPELGKVKFLAFGDSVTEGTISSPCPANDGSDTLWMTLAVSKPESYPFKLQGLLSARYVDQTVVVDNEGEAGKPAIGDLGRLKSALDSAEPEVLLLLHGFNDLLAAGRHHTFGTTIPKIASALEDMVKSGRSHRAAVLLATLPAGNAAGCRGQGAPGIPALNEEIRKVAADEGAVLVDLYAALGGSPEGVIGIDGLHPTEEGYTKMAQVWFDAVKGEFEKPSATSAAPVLAVPGVRFP